MPERKRDHRQPKASESKLEQANDYHEQASSTLRIPCGTSFSFVAWCGGRRSAGRDLICMLKRPRQ
jgi:hypothetical protein